MSVRRESRSKKELTLITTGEGAEGATGPLKKNEERQNLKDKEQPKKTIEIEAKSPGLQIYIVESRPFSNQISYELLVTGIRAGN